VLRVSAFICANGLVGWFTGVIADALDRTGVREVRGNVIVYGFSNQRRRKVSNIIFFYSVFSVLISFILGIPGLLIFGLAKLVNG
jgi:hypothetical protein